MAIKPEIVTPHAAVIVWNYKDRLGNTPKSIAEVNAVDKVIISTLSCISIETSKSKSNPQGSFQIALAPNRNWVSAITPGSWCAILMSNEPLTYEDLHVRANSKKVKMFGKIDSVRVNTAMDQSGTRQTQYMMSGVDWGYVFNNILYVDPNLDNPDVPKTLGQGTAVNINNLIFNKGAAPTSFTVATNLEYIVGLFGKSIGGLNEQGDTINRLGNAVYDFCIPSEVAQYFNFIGRDGAPSSSQKINSLLSLFHGSLIGDDKYSNTSEAVGYLDPHSLQGVHSLWQILMENSNPALNEMLCDLKWEKNGVRLALYNRIKPFSFKGYKSSAGSSNSLRSYFQHLKTTTIKENYIKSVNAGTNWADKYNFIEVKPAFTDFKVFENWYKTEAQSFDQTAFQREGFRPLIAETKQFPSNGSADLTVNYNALAAWSGLMREWYFDTHRMLNGTLTMVGMSPYIGVGENIKFDAKLLNPTANFTSSQVDGKTDTFILAHVESINHSFSLSANNARQWNTTITFVRGLVVDRHNVAIHESTLDTLASSIHAAQSENTVNTFSTSDTQDPSPHKVRGK